MANPKRILSIHIKRVNDEHPDTSYLGEFSQTKKSDYAIPHAEREHNSRVMDWFNPCYQNYEGCTEEEIKKYCEQDYQRMRGLNNSDWYFIGIYAEAEITTGDTIQHIRSGGLYGIESDSTEDHFKTTADDELSQLSDILYQLGFSKRAIATACKNVITTED